MMRQIKPLPVSEEMLGAYLEGNLSLEESRYVEDLIGNDDDLQAFVGDVTTLDVDNEVSIYDECPDFDTVFELPEILMELESFVGSSLSPLDHESSFLENIASSLTPEVTNVDSEIIDGEIHNSDINEVLDINFNANDEDFSFDVDPFNYE